MTFAEIKLIMEKPYLAHEIVPVSQRSQAAKSKAYLRGDNLLDVKSEYQRVKENVGRIFWANFSSKSSARFSTKM